MVANNENSHDGNNDNKPPSNGKIRNHDRRPRGVHPMRRRTISLTREIDRLAENERLRRKFPSVSALIEHAVAKEVQHKEAVEEAHVLDVLRDMQLALHRLERESAERDVIQVELIAGLARAQFAITPVPEREEQQARIEQSKTMFDRYLDAVGRKIESGQTTLAQLPDLPPGAAPPDSISDEENLPPESGGEGAPNDDV
jgi:hypothetical protein